MTGELYEREKISLGQAAELAGVSKRAFIINNGVYGCSIFRRSEEGKVLHDISNE